MEDKFGFGELLKNSSDPRDTKKWQSAEEFEKWLKENFNKGK